MITQLFLSRQWLLSFSLSVWTGICLTERLVAAEVGDRLKVRRFELLSPERIADLPAPERQRWEAYLAKSSERFETEFKTLAAECSEQGLKKSQPAPSNSKEFEIQYDAKDAWYGSEEASKLTEVILSYQTPSGGWSKSIDYSKGPRRAGTHWTTQSGEGWHYCGTIDNRSTTEQLKFLAAVFTATQSDKARAGFMRGIEWIFEGQYPNGGWPQNYPIEPGYHEAITLNDNAMTHVLEILNDIQSGVSPFAWTDAGLRTKAAASFQQGLDCVSAAQIHVNGVRTVWCAQHDPLSLAPIGARKKEPPSLSGSESAELLKFLMRKGPLTPDVSEMVEPALKWFGDHRITGLKKTKNTAGKTDYVSDPESREVYWARFYDVKTGKPMFAGAQDGIVYDTFSEMAAKNKVGYDYFTTKPGDLIEKEVARWKNRKK